MKIGRVVGTVVSTISAPVFDGRRLLLCDLLDASGQPDGSYLICVDTVGSGAGEAVLIVDEGNSARQVIGMPTARSGPSSSAWSTSSRRTASSCSGRADLSDEVLAVAVPPAHSGEPDACREERRAQSDRQLREPGRSSRSSS